MEKEKEKEKKKKENKTPAQKLKEQKSKKEMARKRSKSRYSLLKKMKNKTPAQKLKKKKLLNCHNCNSLKVEKSLMAPKLITKKSNDKTEKQLQKLKHVKKKIFRIGIYCVFESALKACTCVKLSFNHVFFLFCTKVRKKKGK